MAGPEDVTLGLRRLSPKNQNALPSKRQTLYLNPVSYKVKQTFHVRNFTKAENFSPAKIFLERKFESLYYASFCRSL